jgi:hypothetical protein
MLSELQLAAMRAQVTASFDQVATLQRATLTPDGNGGMRAATTTVATGVRCRIGQPASANERAIAEKMQLPAVHVLTFAYDTDVRVGDVIVIGSRQFVAQQVFGPRSYPVHLRVACLEPAAGAA